jgi:hypothetical protein
VASKVETKDAKNRRSKDKKAGSKSGKGGSKDKKEKRKGLKMPMDVEPGPEGEVSRTNRISDAVH